MKNYSPCQLGQHISALYQKQTEGISEISLKKLIFAEIFILEL